MNNLLKIIGLTALLTLIPSCSMYKYTTIEPCIPKNNSEMIQELKTDNNYLKNQLHFPMMYW